MKNSERLEKELKNDSINFFKTVDNECTAFVIPVGQEISSTFFHMASKMNAIILTSKADVIVSVLDSEVYVTLTADSSVPYHEIGTSIKKLKEKLGEVLLRGAVKNSDEADRIQFAIDQLNALIFKP